MTRLLIGLSVGSGREAADAVAVRVDGAGLGMTPRVASSARVPLPAGLRDTLRAPSADGPADAAGDLGELLALAVRQVAARAGAEVRAVFAVGYLSQLPEPAPASPAEWVAEQTGLTVVTGFRGRDVAAGGSGQFITPAADSLLFGDPDEDRLLVHLGSVTSALFLPAGGKLTDVVGFECGPGNRLLDDLASLGTRGREPFDPGGTKAVQGRCLDDLLTAWLAHPHLRRKPPKAVPRAAFDGPFLTDAFEAARSRGATLNDLLCTAGHFVARCVRAGVGRWAPVGGTRVFVSGGGTRNGFLWKRLEEEFAGRPVDRTDVLGVPAGGRSAAAAAVLAALTLDGVAANLPLLTGAAGGRLVGRLIPGDQRNWAACAAWMADQLAGYPALSRAA